MAHQELLLNWLKDAYAMEHNLVQVLQNHAKDAKDYPTIQSKIQEHLEITRRQAEEVKGLIEARGGKISVVKAGLSTVMGAITGVSTGVAEDELVKNCLQDYATENFEIACYRALIEAGRQFNDDDIVSVCQRILREEQDMAHFLERNLPAAVQDVLNKKAAKHREAGA